MQLITFEYFKLLVPIGQFRSKYYTRTLLYRLPLALSKSQGETAFIFQPHQSVYEYEARDGCLLRDIKRILATLASYNRVHLKLILCYSICRVALLHLDFGFMLSKMLQFVSRAHPIVLPRSE